MPFPAPCMGHRLLPSGPGGQRSPRTCQFILARAKLPEEATAQEQGALSSCLRAEGLPQGQKAEPISRPCGCLLARAGVHYASSIRISGQCKRALGSLLMIF